METLRFNLSQNGSKFKILNATNGGPWHKRHAPDQYRSNLEDYKAARIPYSRNHDSAMCGIYGGPYSHDITCIFPDFDADPYNPDSYDFACTDESILICLEAGTETFFRLGQTIEHQIKKHGIYPPKDFKKWAIICEHIIRHYNEGWANGYHLNIQYWEIWNEPDLDEKIPSDDISRKRTWTGTKEQFFDFYAIASKHLKLCFPHLKIGGPALAGKVEWAEDFLRAMSERNIDVDFFSWHIYCNSIEKMVERAEKIRSLLDQYGYVSTESILNEYNYGLHGKFICALKAIHGIKGAAFTMACISSAQQSSIDMLMYYDTRPSVFNGAFDFYTYERLKGYYPLYWYGMFYDMDKEIKAENQIENIYSLCGTDKNNKVLAVITHYNHEDDAENKKINIDLNKKGTYEIYLLDSKHNGELIKTTEQLEFDMSVNSVILIKEI